jgi:hypothetical protein
MGSFLIGVASSLVATIVIAAGLALRARLPLWRTLRLAFGVTPRLARAGVSNVFPSRDDYVRYRKQRSATEYMQTAERQLTYVGYWLAQASEIEKLNTTILGLLGRGVDVTLVLLDEALPAPELGKIADVLGLPSSGLASRLETAWQEMTRLKAGIPVGMSGSLVLRRHRCHLSASAFLFDRGASSAKTLIDIKLYGVGRQGTVGVELQPPPKGAEGSLYERVTTSFETVASSSELVG